MNHCVIVYWASLPDTVLFKTIFNSFELFVKCALEWVGTASVLVLKKVTKRIDFKMFLR